MSEFITDISKNIQAFKVDKAALKDNNFPAEETNKIIDKYFKSSFSSSVLQQFDSNSIFIPVPSGSGSNTIPALLAKRLAEQTNGSYMDVAIKNHNIEAKQNLSIQKRIDNPISYRLKDESSIPSGKKIFIIDDVITTGESTVRLSKELANHGHKTSGIAGLITINNKNPSERDYERIADKLRMVTRRSKSDITKDLKFCFQPYTRKKIANFEKTLRTPNTIKKGVQLLEHLIRIERSITLQPKSFIKPSH